MLGWLRRLFGLERGPLYGATEQLIFRYWNGFQWIHADPMVLWKRLMEVGPALSIDIKVARSPSKDARTAHDAMIAKLRTIFSLTPADPLALDKGGLGETEVAELLDEFMEFCELQKKNTNPSVILPEVTSVSSASSTDAGLVTPNGLVSGSIANESNTDGPGPSPSEPELPSEVYNPMMASSEPLPMEKVKLGC